MANEESAECCGECSGDDLEVTGFRGIRQSSRRDGPGVVVARRTDYRCRDCGCDSFIVRRVPPTIPPDPSERGEEVIPS